jgi:Domain of unknown function (DUF5916)/Carbohydrate family 9 binding domain-like
VRDVIYFLNRDAGQIYIAVDTVVRYQAGSSLDNLTFYVDLFETTIGPALAVQTIAPDDPFLRQIRVLQTARTSTRVAIDLKVPQVPEIEVAPALAIGQPSRLILRWNRVPSPSQLVSRAARSESQQVLIQGPLKTLRAVRARGPLSIDGHLDEETWSLITPFDDFLQRDPDEGKPASERTELRVAYDDNALYVGVRLFDSAPEGIVRRRSRRDGDEDADSVALYLDPRHDRLTGFKFEVSAAGVQRDEIIFNDWQTDTRWDGVWESAVSEDQEGWTAEMRIPFSQLRFSSADQQTWGINLSRSIPRKHESAWLELVPKQERGLASRMANLAGLDGIKPTLHLELLPYTVARAEFNTPQPGDPFNDGSRLFGGAGLDLKWGLQRSLTLDATVNPDFGQVEVDPAVINLTAFETFFDEKRPFFIEGSQIFTNFGRGGSGSSLLNQKLFYSRRIGLAPPGNASAQFVDRPQATTILGAAKLTGKTDGGLSVGLLEAVTSPEYAQLAEVDERARIEVAPLSNFFVGRAMREWNRAGLGLLATATTRDTSNPELRNRLVDRALVAGIDGYSFLDGQRDWVVSGQIAGSWIAGSTSALLEQQVSSRRYYQRPDAEYLAVDPTADSLSGWSGAVGIRRNNGSLKPNAGIWASSPGFEANDLGFQARTDVVGATTGFSWTKYTPDRLTRQRELEISKFWGWNFGRDLRDDWWSIGGSATLRNYWDLSGYVVSKGRVFDDRFTRSGPLAQLPAGGEGSVGISSDSRKRFIAGIDSSFGWDDSGASKQGTFLHLDFRPTPSLAISSGPYVMKSDFVTQYVDTIIDPYATNTYGARYVFADLRQTSIGLTTRFNVSLTPNVSLQVYLEPFSGVGTYEGLKEFAKPRTFDFLRYGSSIGTIAYDKLSRTYEVDPDGKGPAAPFEISNPDFNVKSLVGKAVFRWQWRPGSTLYVAWTQQRFNQDYAGEFNFGRDARALLSSPADDVFLVKLSYWLGR